MRWSESSSRRMFIFQMIKQFHPQLSSFSEVIIQLALVRPINARVGRVR